MKLNVELYRIIKERGVESVGLIASDGLTSIENTIAKSFPNAQHQICVVNMNVLC